MRRRAGAQRLESLGFHPPPRRTHPHVCSEATPPAPHHGHPGESNGAGGMAPVLSASRCVLYNPTRTQDHRVITMSRTLTHEADVCVIGGGMAGLAAALSAARHGADTVLMHDRPVLGGNASSECRVHISGADRHNRRPNARETGILEELRLANLCRNPQRSYSVWDAILYDTARREEGLRLMLNCSAQQACMADGRIESVTGWQGTTQTHHRVRARIFIDCSGDAVLAPLTGAAFRIGREGREEFGESFAPERPDRGTMGMTLAFAAAEHDSPQPFTAPPWAHRFDRCEDLPGGHGWWELGYWWIELGGLADSIHDTEQIRDQLLAVVLGVWDHIKNRCPHHRRQAANWALNWLQFLPAKRESRRYVGRHVLSQQDLMSGGHFPDVVAYGGWTIDEHPPVGVGCAGLGLRPAYHGDTPIYGIPYGTLVARDIPNLMFAGRCASCTHIAMSSARVMGTATVMGQAAGTAAALAVRRGIDPPEVSDHVGQLQQALLADDAYLPGVRQEFSETTVRAKLIASAGDPEPLRDGINRPVGDEQHAWNCRVGDALEMVFPAPAVVERLTLIADSGLDQLIQMSHWQADDQRTSPPESLLADARLEVRIGGRWVPAGAVRGNYQRLVRIDVARRCEGIRLTIEKTWGAEQTRLFAAYVD